MAREIFKEWELFNIYELTNSYEKGEKLVVVILPAPVLNISLNYDWLKGKGKVTPLQARLWPRGRYRYTFTLPRPRR
jgi:hypothetical protein